VIPAALPRDELWVDIVQPAGAREVLLEITVEVGVFLIVVVAEGVEIADDSTVSLRPGQRDA
jgi:hypothetical protein